MKIKMTERCVTVGDLRKFLDKLDANSVPDDEKLNPDSAKLIADSQREHLKSMVSPDMRTFSDVVRQGMSSSVRAKEALETATKQGVVLWVEQDI